MKGDFNIEKPMNSEILNYAIEQGIIDLSHIQDAVNMNKRKEILEQHPYSIWESKDGKWHTYLPDEEKGRVPRKRNSKKEIENLIVDYYKEQVGHSFKDWWRKWEEKQVRYGVSNNTLLKYNSDYTRFFEDDSFESMDIRSITEEDITEIMVKCVKKYNLKEKGAKALFGYIRGVFKHARIKKEITENPCEYIEPKAFLRFCNQSIPLLDDRVIPQHEVEILLNVIKEDQKKTPNYIPLYAVELAFYTGMRIGELTGLKWSNIREDLGCILIQYSEKLDRKEKRYYIAKTKTGKERLFPLTDDIKRILNEVKKQELKYGYFNEFVFSGENGKIHFGAIADCLRYRCKKSGIKRRTIHDIRRTVNSEMRTSGVSSVVAASLLGHTEKVNRKNYTYDLSSIDKKKEIVSNLYKAM